MRIQGNEEDREVVGDDAGKGSTNGWGEEEDEVGRRLAVKP
jgi:hypothetical protein